MTNTIPKTDYHHNDWATSLKCLWLPNPACTYSGSTKLSGEPAKQGRAVFAEAVPVPSSAASRALHSPEHPIFQS
ncbi:hypothetical protein JG687_00017437 [Phytophthora cactorum]|uniref:Uncharacterized protein n=1 Tax=Phytophthora cactorum TaxID=29920 RepID=A0A8T1TPY2_9STRA|nr:hypothetical protein JG687_00017437 [Phytophthora cactorum]